MNPIRNAVLILAGMATLASPARAAVSAAFESVTRITAHPARFERVDFVITLTATWRDPFQADDIRVDLDLVAPSGRHVILPAYFERGESGQTSVWHARFAPREAGSYRGHFTLVAQGAQSTSQEVAFSVAPSASKGFLHVATPWIFRFDTGEPFRGIGENLCWEARAFDDSAHFKALHENPRYNYEYLLGTLSSNGGNFFRTWMCAWNLPLEWKKVSDTARYVDDPGHFNASAIQRMDQLVELAHRTDTYFMLALDPHGSLLGPGWDTNPYNQKNGGPAATPADFFTNPAARRQYQDRLRYLVARWGYSPHLAVWEFFNEVDNAMYSQKAGRIPDEGVTAWHAEMSAYLKQLDPYERPITTSVSHREVAGLPGIPSIDLNQRHIYKNTDSIPSTLRTRVQETGKPYIIGEYSYEWDWTKDFNQFAPQMDADFKNGLWLGLFSPTPVLPMSWWWEFFDERKLPAYFARVRALHEMMLSAGHGEFAEFAVEWKGPPLRHVLAVKCGTTRFVFLANRESAPAEGHLSLLPADAARSIRIFDPESDRFTDRPKTRRPLERVDGLTIPANGNLILILSGS
jgi:hypothetical protein